MTSGSTFPASLQETSFCGSASLPDHRKEPRKVVFPFQSFQLLLCLSSCWVHQELVLLTFQQCTKEHLS